MSTAYELFYRKITAHQGLPFDVRIPTRDTVNAMQDARNGKGKRYDNIDSMFKKFATAVDINHLKCTFF